MKLLNNKTNNELNATTNELIGRVSKKKLKRGKRCFL